MIELEKINKDFSNIIGFINRTYKNRKQAFQEESIINGYINSINMEYLPMIRELIIDDYFDDDFFDSELDKIIVEYKSVIRKWKKEMTSFYEKDRTEEDIKENTDNLVFCINSDIDIKEKGYQDELTDTIKSLESKSSQELKMRSGRKGMTRLRKTKENNKEQDFVEYFKGKMQVNIHFVPYRYSSDADYRTGVIKFEPSTSVKEFLEERYGLSKQSAYYGIFDVISVVRADHSQYHEFEGYILDNYSYIEEIASLFASNSPDYHKLSELLDKFLNIKKDLIQKTNNNSMKV